MSRTRFCDGGEFVGAAEFEFSDSASSMSESLVSSALPSSSLDFSGGGGLPTGNFRLDRSSIRSPREGSDV